jgi:twitching motility protein PilT
MGAIMDTNRALTEKIYQAGPAQKLSIHDLLDYFLKQGAMRVSDLHLKAGSPPTYRVDGHLQRLKGEPLDAATMQAFAAAMLSEANLARLRQDGAVDASYMTQRLQFRFNCFTDNDGVAIAIRALESRIVAVENLGFPNQVWRDIMDKQQGLVLVTGITGAGKSTTIASLIDRILREQPVRVITLEDPIEYRIRPHQGLISQREIGRDCGSFERGLRDALREDPDVIFVGEMRDRESAAWTLTAAETGHLVFSTLHTRDARGTITRVLDMFPSNQQDEVASQLSLGLRYVICQKLVPLANGQGRVAAMEILNNSYAVANLIRTGKVEQMYSQIQTRSKDIPSERMITAERHLALLVQAGKITQAEAQTWANDPQSFVDEMSRIEAETPNEDLPPPPPGKKEKW